jgi:hypothetical protein
VWVELGQETGHEAVRPRQVQQLAGLLGLRRGTAAAAHLTRLRAWAAEHAPDGSLTGRSPRAIARAAGWRGDPETLLAALAGAGYLRRRPGGTQLRSLTADAAVQHPGAQTWPGQVQRSQPLAIAPSGGRLHVSGLWQAALRELAGMVNRANFEAFLRDTIGLYQSGSWVTIGVPSAYVQDVLAQRFQTAIDRALYEVTGRPLRARLILLPPLPPTSA